MEFNQVLDWRAGPGVCRCCLSEGCYKDISTEYFWMGEKEIYAEMLLECYSLTISYQEGRPNSNSRLICEVCITRLRDAANFKKQVINSERNFAKHLIEVPVEREVEVTYTPTESLPIQQVKDESRVSDDGDFDDSQFDANFDCDDDADDQPLKNFATNVLKREDTVPDVTVEKVKTKDGKSPSKRKAAAKKGGVSPAKKAKAMKQEKEAKPSSSKPPKTERKKGSNSAKWTSKTDRGDQRKSFYVYTASKKVVDKPSVYLQVKKSPTQVHSARLNAEIILQCSTAYPFRTTKNTMICVCCCSYFDNPSVFRQHMDDEHEVFNISTAFIKQHTFDPIRVDITNLRCKICSVEIDNLSSLVSHLKNDHEKPLDTNGHIGVIPFKADLCNWNCQLCSETFKSLLRLNHHMSAHYQNYVCESCGKGFITETALRHHVKISHDSSNTIFACSRCKQEFPTLAAKLLHVKNDHNLLPYCCPKCKERFATWDQRLRHLSTSHGLSDPVYKCQLCSKTFKARSSRYNHFRTIHSQEKNYGCQHCEARFTTKCSLENHAVKHTGERPFKCEVCLKAYARKKTLIQHMRIHNNDRRFVCTLCGQSFVQKCSLKGHMKVHHPGAVIESMSP